MNANRDRDEEIFDAARELADEERAAYLAKMCGQDADLRQRIEAMLEADAAAGEFFKTEVAPPSRLIVAEANLSPSIEKAGDRIGRYKLLQQIGEGGMGLVYMAEQDQPVRRSVALKIIKLGMDTRQVVARFEAERQALAMMNHPHIAKVFDAGATESGRPYFVMELVRGIPITEYCDTNCLPTRQRLELFILVCQAVQHAHQKGIIHRDLKPSNILVTSNDGVPWPMIIDFGVAKATHQRLTEKTLFTHFAQMIGTPAYMSPEQAEMSKLDVDTRADIYALGVLLYELLTGSTPFPTKELLSLGYREMQRTIAEREPPRLSTRLSTMTNEERTVVAKNRSVDVTALAKLFRGDLDWIAMKCLEKDRARRYETANGLAADIQRHLNCEPVVARPPSRLYEFQKTVRRHKLGFAATGAVIIALSLGLVGSTWEFVQKNRAFQRATAAELEQNRLRQIAEAKEQQSQQVAQFLKDMLKGVGPSVAAGRDTKLLKEILDKTAERVNKDLNDQPEVEAELRNTIGFVYFELGQYDESESMFRQSLELMRKVWGPQHATVAETLHKLAETLRREGKRTEAATVAREALAIYEHLYGRQHATIGATLNLLGFTLAQSANFGEANSAEAEAILREALAINQKVLGAHHPQVGLSLSRLGIALEYQNRFAEAEAVLGDAVKIQRKALGAAPDLGLASPQVELGWTLLALGRVSGYQGRLAEAEKMYREAVAAMGTVLSDEHWDMRQAKDSLLDCLIAQGKWPDVELLDRDLIPLANKLHKEVDLLRFQGDPKANERKVRQVLERYQETVGRDHPSVGVVLNTLGLIVKDLGQFSEAEAMLREALEINRKHLGADHLQVGIALSRLGIVLEAEHKLDEAATLLQQAAAVQRKALAAGPSDLDPKVELGYTLCYLARVLDPLGRPVEAEAACREALSVTDSEAIVRIATQLLGKSPRAQGKLGAVEAIYRDNLADSRKRFGNDSAVVAGSLRELAALLLELGRPDDAEPFLREALAIRSRAVPMDDIQLAGEAAVLTLCLLIEGKFTEAEAPARACLAIRETKLPDNWLTFNSRSQLGGSLLGQKKYAEAEPLLLSAYEGMRQREAAIPPQGKVRIQETLQRLVQLYEATGEPEKAAEWNKKLAEFDQAGAEEQNATPKRQSQSQP